MTLFQKGEFTGHAGQLLPWKVECDSLTPEDWDCLAYMASRDVIVRASKIVPVPRGGIPFAEALTRYIQLAPDGPVLVVDDVLTTGTSIREVMAQHGFCMGLVVFSRMPSFRMPWNVSALWRYGG